jgi:hypothetical protein
MPQKPRDPWDELPDADAEWDSLPEVTDMDKPLESRALGVSPESFAQTVQPVSSEPYQPSLWERFRSPMTDIFSRAGQALEDFGGHPDYSQMSHLDPYQQMELGALSEAPSVIGQAADSMTAPMNAIPAIATLGGSATASPILNGIVRGAGALQAVSGVQNTLEADNPVSAGLGILETLGGGLGAAGKFNPKAPKAEIAPGYITGKSTLSIPGDVKVPAVAEAVTEAAPKVNNLDYSPTSLKKATKIVGENGLPMENLSANQIIELAETLQPGHQGSKTAAEIINKSIAKPNLPKVTLNKDGTWTPEKYPDYKVNAQTGEIVGTHSGKPVDLKTVPEEVKRGFITEAGNTARAMVGSMDMSFPFRQGLGLIHKGAWWKAWGPMVKSFGSDKAFQAVQDSIAAKPLAQGKNVMEGGKAVYKPSVYERAGLAITDNSTARELEHMRSKAENLPWVKASNRSYTAFANKLRSDTFDSIVNDFAKAGVDITKDDTMLKALGDFVNNASGRGSLKGVERYADVLNATLFSPRLIEARMKMFGNSAVAMKDIALDPQQFAMMGPSVQKEYLKSMMAMAGAWTTMAGLAASAGADVSLDPTSSDFGKIKVGDTRLDPAGGFQQFLVLAARTSQLLKQGATGEMEGGPFAKSVADIGGNFLYNKEAPLTRYIHDFLRAKNNNYDRMDIPESTARLVVPIILQNLLEIYNDENGNAGQALTAIPDFFGIGTQSFGGDIRRRMLGDLGSDLTYPQRQRSIFNP